jgi:hypothetical protein
MIGVIVQCIEEEIGAPIGTAGGARSASVRRARERQKCRAMHV